LFSGDKPWGGAGFSNDIPEVCEKEGARGPRAFLCLEPGDGHGPADESSAPSAPRSFQCMCGLPPRALALGEAVRYEVQLMQDVLNTALANATLYGTTLRRGFIDFLTGLKTSQVIGTHAGGQRQLASTSGGPCCLAIVNVDDMGKINEEYGCEAGDQVLRDLADALRDCARETDVITRGRGAEFMLLLPETTLQAGLRLIEHIQARVSGEVTGLEGRTVTLSCGVVEGSPSGGDDVEQMLGRAERALNRAKRLGRDCVIAYEPQTASMQA